MTSTKQDEHYIAQWKDQEEGRLIFQTLEYLDTVSLIQKKSVCKGWQRLCTNIIDNKCSKDKKAFQSKKELQQAVNKYSPGFYFSTHCPPTDAEDIATAYGYPINKWDVSNVTDFSEIFHYKYHFNEAIGSWDVSNATNMSSMFYFAKSFDMDLSSWDVSNVKCMWSMFSEATSFNQDISSWDVYVSGVFSFNGMFHNCPIDNARKPVFNLIDVFYNGIRIA